MALIDLSIYSEALGMQTSVYVIIPQQNTKGEIGIKGNTESGKYKCLYLLHGLTDDQSIWMRRTSIERYAAEHGICIIMPTGAKSFYTDMRYGMKYYTYIAQELPKIIEGMFNVSREREDRFIGGNSMGGYGAIKIALKEKNRYGAAFALSPVSDIHNKIFAETLLPVFGEVIPDSDDLFCLTSERDTDEVKPRIYITIGEKDFMYEDSVRLNKHLEDLSYDYKYCVTPGGHAWELWDTTVQDAIKWMLCKE